MGNDEPCVEKPLTGDTPKVWTWLKTAKDTGKTGAWIDGSGKKVPCAWWAGKDPDTGDYLSLCWNEAQYPHAPLLEEHNKTNGDILFRDYRSFDPSAPSDDHFTIPSKCPPPPSTIPHTS